MAGVDAVPLGMRFTKPRWMRDGACLEHPELSWFPERGMPTAPAKAVCASCLVRDECLAYALDNPLMHGIWGATSDRERRAMKRRQHAA